MRRVLPILLTLALAALLVVAPRPTVARADRNRDWDGSTVASIYCKGQ